MKISVIICTWNRAPLLDETLARMAQLELPDGVRWELLVVNNACTDATDQVLARHAGVLPLRRLHEPRPGLSNARNCALAAADGDLILWTDDDVLVSPTWLRAYHDAARAYPDASFFAGTIDPLFPVEPPSWILQNLKIIEGPFALRQFGEEVRPLGKYELPYGANMGFRKNVLSAGCFDPMLGPVHDELLRYEEWVVCRRLLREGKRGLWVGPARVRHYIHPERLTKEYIWNFFVGLGRSQARMEPLPQTTYWFGMPRYAIRRYWERRLASLLFSPIDTRRWLKNYMAAAQTLGFLREVRALRRVQAGTRRAPAAA